MKDLIEMSPRELADHRRECDIELRARAVEAVERGLGHLDMDELLALGTADALAEHAARLERVTACADGHWFVYNAAAVRAGIESQRPEVQAFLRSYTPEGGVAWESDEPA